MPIINGFNLTQAEAEALREIWREANELDRWGMGDDEDYTEDGELVELNFEREMDR